MSETAIVVSDIIASARAAVNPLCSPFLGANRIGFGSDTPFALMHVCVAEYNALLDGEVTPEEKAQIMGGNILRLLNRGE